MPLARPNASKKIKYLDVKLFIGALTLATTVGFWNLFASDAVLAEKLAPAVVSTLPPQTQPAGGLGLPPLPTLVPLASASTDAPSAGSPGQAAAESTPLRSVSLPTQVIVQKSAPIVDQAVVAAGGGGGKAVATTRSSR
jgi:hypothetical protein